MHSYSRHTIQLTILRALRILVHALPQSMMFYFNFGVVFFNFQIVNYQIRACARASLISLFCLSPRSYHQRICIRTSVHQHVKLHFRTKPMLNSDMISWVSTITKLQDDKISQLDTITKVHDDKVSQLYTLTKLDDDKTP